MITKKSYVLEPLDRVNFLANIAKQGITQIEVCKKVGISFTMLWMILRGQRTISQETYDKFVEIGIDFKKMADEAWEKTTGGQAHE